jgi:hypothetical protein
MNSVSENCVIGHWVALRKMREVDNTYCAVLRNESVSGGVVNGATTRMNLP